MARSSEVVDHQDRWSRDFEVIRRHLWPAVSAVAVAVAVEHIGSTAVPGLAAKPVIDVDVVVPERRSAGPAVAALESLGYEHRGDQGVPGREAFAGGEGLPEHHPYVVVLGSAPHRDHVDLRDHLRRDPGAARRYAAEKRRLAHLLLADREAYVEGKAWLVRELLQDARRREGSFQPNG